MNKLNNRRTHLRVLFLFPHQKICINQETRQSLAPSASVSSEKIRKHRFPSTHRPVERGRGRFLVVFGVASDGLRSRRRMHRNVALQQRLSALSSIARAGLLNFSIFPVRDLERNRITAREWLFRYRDVDGGWQRQLYPRE